MTRCRTCNKRLDTVKSIILHIFQELGLMYEMHDIEAAKTKFTYEEFW